MALVYLSKNPMKLPSSLAFFFFFLWVQYLICFLLISFGFNYYYYYYYYDDFSLLFAHPPERRGSFAVGEFHSCCELFIGNESRSQGVRDKLSCESFRVWQKRHVFTKTHPFKGKIWGLNLFRSIQSVFLCFWGKMGVSREEKVLVAVKWKWDE